jgi:hypothetical protein
MEAVSESVSWGNRCFVRPHFLSTAQSASRLHRGQIPGADDGRPRSNHSARRTLWFPHLRPAALLPRTGRENHRRGIQ